MDNEKLELIAKNQLEEYERLVKIRCPEFQLTDFEKDLFISGFSLGYNYDK